MSFDWVSQPTVLSVYIHVTCGHMHTQLVTRLLYTSQYIALLLAISSNHVCPRSTTAMTQPGHSSIVLLPAKEACRSDKLDGHC